MMCFVQVFTEKSLLARGHCCGNRCRHCPYGHFRVARMPRLNRVRRPLLLCPCPQISDCATKRKISSVLAWPGSMQACLGQLQALRQQGSGQVRLRRALRPQLAGTGALWGGCMPALVGHHR